MSCHIECTDTTVGKPSATATRAAAQPSGENAEMCTCSASTRRAARTLRSARSCPRRYGPRPKFLVVAMAVPGVSYARALTAPGSATLGMRTVD